MEPGNVLGLLSLIFLVIAVYYNYKIEKAEEVTHGMYTDEITEYLERAYEATIEGDAEALIKNLERIKYLVERT